MPISEHSGFSLRTRLMLLFMLFLFASSLTGAGVALYYRFNQTDQRRETQRAINFYVQRSIARQNQALRIVLCAARQEVNHTKNITPEQRRRANKFYDEVLKKIRARPCGKEVF